MLLSRKIVRQCRDNENSFATTTHSLLMRGFTLEIQKTINFTKKNLTTIDTLVVGATAELYQLDGDTDIVNRLMDMGLRPGLQIEYITRMLGSGPIVIRLDTTFLALREEEAQCLKVAL